MTTHVFDVASLGKFAFNVFGSKYEMRWVFTVSCLHLCWIRNLCMAVFSSISHESTCNTKTIWIPDEPNNYQLVHRVSVLTCFIFRNTPKHDFISNVHEFASKSGESVRVNFEKNSGWNVYKAKAVSDALIVFKVSPSSLASRNISSPMRPIVRMAFAKTANKQRTDEWIVWFHHSEHNIIITNRLHSGRISHISFCCWDIGTSFQLTIQYLIHFEIYSRVFLRNSFDIWTINDEPNLKSRVDIYTDHIWWKVIYSPQYFKFEKVGRCVVAYWNSKQGEDGINHFKEWK